MEESMIKIEDYNQIHCIGIGGIGLSAIAEILLDRNLRVTGSDMKESDLTDRLISKGANIYLGHREKNVEGADLVVYSAAVGEDNPELAKARELGIPTVTRADILGTLMGDYPSSIAVAGTHGKTTTTSMVSLILEKADMDPTILIGGNLQEIGGNVKVGKSPYFITEACEYMDSFLNLRPKIEIILNIDSDHLDYFKDIDHIVRSFETFAGLVPEDGTIIALASNPFVQAVIRDLPNVITFGLTEDCTYWANNIRFTEDGYPQYELYHKEEFLVEMSLSVPGEHNILNSLAAFSCGHTLGVSIESMQKTLKGFKGTQRRFDIQGRTDQGVVVIDDYAHHPTEIKATLKAAKNINMNKLWCLFQPHTYTRTMALFEEFTESFDDADCLILAEIYAAREKNIFKISSKAIAEKIKEKYPGKFVYYFETFEEIADFVYENAQDGDYVITMGAGDIYKAGEMILEKDFEK
ncbi:MAG: UDP-N-acetylmuramate--L-alanine ligase [Anaerovoracaceae bacterium]|nr:UDP-N-acetylmuramate--L-alanine ligase [Anaerovoracaceae bacterium]